jgi:hypothetical protein
VHSAHNHKPPARRPRASRTSNVTTRERVTRLGVTTRLELRGDFHDQSPHRPEHPPSRPDKLQQNEQPTRESPPRNPRRRGVTASRRR